jgi:hypothetical protein
MDEVECWCMVGAKHFESLGLLTIFARVRAISVPNVVKVGDKNRFFLFFLCFFSCYSIVLWFTSDLSLFQYNDAQFFCAFEKKKQ